MLKLQGLRKYLPLILLGVNFAAAILMYVASSRLGAPDWANLFNSILLIFLLSITEGVFYKPEKAIPQWYEMISDPGQFKEKFEEIKKKSHTIYMVWCANYGDAKALEPYFNEENSLLCQTEKKLVRLINTTRIAGRGKLTKDGEELFDEHIKWMNQAKSVGKYECFKTSISEYEVAIGMSYNRARAVEVIRVCLVINDEYDPKFMIYFDSSKGEEAKGIVRGLQSWFVRERDIASARSPP